MIECECCRRPVVSEKMKGIGYYCEPCFAVCWCGGDLGYGLWTIRVLHDVLEMGIGSRTDHWRKINWV